MAQDAGMSPPGAASDLCSMGETHGEVAQSWQSRRGVIAARISSIVHDEDDRQRLIDDVARTVARSDRQLLSFAV
jgi:hypothetical protein